MAKFFYGTLLLVRRPRVAPEWDQTALGQSNPPVAKGQQQTIKAAVKTLAELNPARVLASDLARSREFADAIAAKAGVSLGVRRDLREQRMGQWQGKRWAEVIAEDEERALEFLSSFTSVAPPRGETGEAMAKRVLKAILAECRRQPRQVVAYVGHAGPIRAVLAHALELPLSAVQRIQLDPLSLTIVRWSGEASTIGGVNYPLGEDALGQLPS